MSGIRLSGSGLTREFDSGVGVHGIGLDVQAGQVHALVGLNGAGKTTLLRLLLGMLRPDAGTVRIDGHDLPHLDAAGWARVGHLVGPPLAYPELTVRANLSVAARLHGVPSPRIDRMVAAALSEFDLDRYADVRARVLSEGNRRRVGLAGALQHNPDVIVLDEPTSTLDPAGVILLRERLLREADRGAGILVSSHHLDEVARIAERITVVNHGRLIGTLDPHGTDIERAFFALVHNDDTERTR
ncbi:ABC transporter ATP-binding protein [Nocardia uniformis]|uniref:ABC transporter ATP-binding protein n=1 Tax=Nocardia uniformis TaxID=53432 RepID=A0A849CCJ6_9NOCA|nr:ABC transporter ATP-binding protein [Nocardia uniformis]NNH74140.1 ABC transporter ATP-binding protein [Nocardia uniformis]